MLIIDNITIIGALVLILGALTTPFINPFFRRTKSEKRKENTKETNTEQDVDAIPSASAENVNDNRSLPPISIILTPEDDALALNNNLSLYLSQDYPADFQVIVVAHKKDKETEDILKAHATDRLYTTFIPESSRYMSRKKLAITLGIKAARHNWVLVTDVFCQPANALWLRNMALNINTEQGIIVGNTMFDDATPDFLKFERFHKTLYLLREYSQGKAYRCEGNALLFRKEMFLKDEGFRGNLKFVRGEFDFLVNKYAPNNRVKVADRPDAIQIEPVPTEKMWRNKHLFYMETRKHLERSFRHRLLFNLDQWALHLNYILIVAAIAFSAITFRWLLLAVALFALIITISLRVSFFKRTQQVFALDIPTWKVIPYEIKIIWHNLKFMNEYRKADKYDFISHKL